MSDFSGDVRSFRNHGNEEGACLRLKPYFHVKSVGYKKSKCKTEETPVNCRGEGNV